MSYSFSMVAKSKAEAIEKVKAEFDGIVLSQPSHGTDRDAAESAVTALIAVLTEVGENEKLTVSVSGSLGWRAEGVFTSSNLSIQTYISAGAVAEAIRDTSGL
jgi:hypothetical protein